LGLAVDELGNDRDSELFSFSIDILPPYPFSMLEPTNGTCVTHSTPEFSWEEAVDEGCSGMDHYELWIDGILSLDDIEGTDSGPGSPLSEGVHTWCVWAEDGNENSTSAHECDQWTITVDSYPPMCGDLVSPEDGGVVTVSSPSFCWEPCEDVGTGLVEYELWIGGSLNVDGIGPDIYCSEPYSDLENGTYPWYVVAVDGCGGRTASPTRTVIIAKDLTAPESFIVNPRIGEVLYWTGSCFSIEGISDDGAGSGVVFVEVSTDGGENWQQAVDISGSGDYSSWIYQWCTPSIGWHALMSRATDLAGNPEIPWGAIIVFVYEGEQDLGDLAPFGDPDSALTAADINIAFDLLMSKFGTGQKRSQTSPMDLVLNQA